MTKTRVILIAGTMVLIATIGIVVAMTSDQPGVTKANLRRIQIGMSELEVNEVFGRAKTCYEHSIGPPYCCWNGEAGRAFVYFDENEKVVGCRWVALNSGYFERIRRFFHQ